MAPAALGIALVALAAGCGGSKRAATTETQTQPGPPSGASVFADPRAPLAVTDRGKVGSAPGVTIRDVSFTGLHGRVDGYVALPAHKRNVPAITCCTARAGAAPISLIGRRLREARPSG